MEKQVFYKVTFGDTTQVYNEEGFHNFVKVAVIHNKDIHSFSAERITEEELKDLQTSHDEEESTCERVEKLLREAVARAARIALLTQEIGPTVDGINIVNNVNEALNLLGYEQKS